MNKKYLLVTSDDFGVTRSVNQGILKGFTHGVLKSTNFMATTPWFLEAVRLSKEHQFDVGVHLTLTCEWSNMSYSPITNAPSLVDELGYFLKDYPDLLTQLDMEEVRAEYRAQIERVIKAGIIPTHVETHMLPPLTFPNAEIYRELTDVVESVVAEYGLIYTYAARNGALTYFDDAFEITQKSYQQVTERLSQYDAGIYHIISHCALDEASQRALSDPAEGVYRWAAKCRQDDLDMITSPRFKDFLAENNFELIDVKKLLALHSDRK